MRNVLYIVFLLTCLEAYGQYEKDVYVYPIKQGDREWKNLASIDSRIKVLQIPTDVLVNISTEGLLETCLNFPYLTDILFCNDYQKGFEALVKEFNGFEELLKRKDLINVLLKKNKLLFSNIAEVKYKTEKEKGILSFKCFLLEFILTQDGVFKSLNKLQHKELMKLNIRNKKIKIKYPQVFSELNMLPTYLFYAKKILSDSNFKNKKERTLLLNFTKSPLYVDTKVAMSIENYLNK